MKKILIVVTIFILALVCYIILNDAMNQPNFSGDLPLATTPPQK